jgi:uncharacterized damage-inducible protein DinB
MKELLDQYAGYNSWANKKILELAETLDAEQQHREIASSFSSLYKTIFHMWGAEMVWRRRLYSEATTIEGDPFTGSMKKLSETLQQQDQELVSYVMSKNNDTLKQKLSYRNSRGQEFSEPIYLILMHLFNHNTYHRGQLVTLFRQLKIEKIPQTDFIAWVRLHGQ